MNISYNQHGSRVTQATWSHRLGKVDPALLPLIGLMAVVAIFLITTGHHAAVALLGLSLALLSAKLYISWQLKPNRPTGALGADPVQLDAILAPDIVGRLNWPLSPQMMAEQLTTSQAAIFIYNRFELHPDLIIPLLSDQPADSQAVIETAIALAIQEGGEQLDSAALLVAAITTSPNSQKFLSSLKLSTEDLHSGYSWYHRLQQLIAASQQHSRFGGIGRDWAVGYTPTLQQFANNLSKEIEAGALHRSVPSHAGLVDQLIATLSRQSGSSAALIGPPGIGKTSLAYQLAERILSSDGPQDLRYYQVMSLNASLIVSSGGQLERIMLTLLGEAVHAKNIILLLDEAQLFFGQGAGAIDISQILLPILQQSSVKIVMTMGASDWQRLGAAIPALANAITPMTVTEPTEPETIAILEEAALLRESAAKAKVTYQALRETYRLADRYLSDQVFPGKAITLLDAAMANPDEYGLISAVSAQQAIERQLGVKVSSAAAPERDKLLHLEDDIHKLMINQTKAVSAVASALRRSRAGVANPSRPVGSFLFLGPTGVGKTELTKALAATYYGGVDQVIRLDMSEYQQPSDVDRLLAASATTRSGSSLVAEVRRQPFSVVLLDEIEKAHPDILNLLLQLLDEGNLTDSGGRKVSFKEAVIICTSNAGADAIRERIQSGQDLEGFETQMTDKLIAEHTFKPELLNRFDDIVLFRPLTKDELMQVVDLLIAEVNVTLAAQHVSVALTPAATRALVDRGYDPRFGARPMRRMVQRAVEDVVAERLLAGTTASGDTITLDAPDVPAAATPADVAETPAAGEQTLNEGESTKIK